ncbi:MAG: hypothetical protein ABEJ76_07810 [Halanaeroarchaeum sp.]
MATSTRSVPFAIDGSSLSPVHDAVAAGPSVVELALVAFLLAAVLVGVVGVLAYVRDADDRLDRELREVAAERDAFLAFADAVNDIAVSQGSAAKVTPQTVQTFDTRGPPIDKVRTAFEDTVMGVDHYDETYGEPWLEHVHAELDPDLAGTLRDRRVVDPAIKRALERRSIEAASKREDLLSVLKTEESALEDATESLAAIRDRIDHLEDAPQREPGFDELAAVHDRLGDLEDRTARLAKRRQRQIQRQTRNSYFNAEELALQEYLYGTLATTYPVLDATVELDDRIERAKRRVRSALTATV